MGQSQLSEQTHILHSKLPGRLRLSIPSIRRNANASSWLTTELSQVSGIKRVSASASTGNVLIEFKPKRYSVKQVVRLTKHALRRKPKELQRRKPKALNQKTVAYDAATSRDWHAMDAKKIIKLLETSENNGLDLKIIPLKRRQHGTNTIPENTSARSDLEIFTEQFRSFPVALLGASAAVSLATGSASDAAAIVAMMMLNGCIGYKTESSSEHIINAVMKEADQKVEVIRSGRKQVIDIQDLVVGDLIVLRHGNVIPADARLISTEGLSIDESILTGESVPVHKHADALKIQKRAFDAHANLVFRGTTITGGGGKAIVTEVGPDTAIGKIQRLMTEVERPRTPMQLQLDKLGDQLATLAMSASGLLLLIGILRRRPLLELLRSSVSMAVAALPESLPTIATTTLARGVQTLKSKHIIVRRLDALETLASVEVLCLDKTGTLTMNRMEVNLISTPRDSFKANEIPVKDASVVRLAKAAALCNDATEKDGSPTETALLHFAERVVNEANSLRRAFPRQKVRYRSEKKRYMMTVHSDQNGKSYVAVKGSPLEVMSLCRKKGANEFTRIKKENERMAALGLRVLGFASGPSEDRLQWLGMVGLADPIRAGMRELVPHIKAAGIEPVMVTGDQPATAAAIARQLGIKKYYAKVSPERKLKIIKKLQKSGKVVAMIGDGVNDGPALRIADVGIAMGQRGSQVATDAAGIVLPKDNIERILLAITEGRRIQQDIQKAVNYILAQNLSEVLVTLLVSALFGEEPFTSMQFLWINLVTDIFPELALAQQPPESDLLKRPPVKLSERFLSRDDLIRILFDSSLLTAAPLLSYARSRSDVQSARSKAFVAMVGSSLFYTFSRRSNRLSIFDRERLPRNHYIPLATGVGFLSEIMSLTIPRLRQLLGNRSMSATEVLMTTAGSALPTIAIELSKYIRNHSAQQQKEK